MTGSAVGKAAIASVLPIILVLWVSDANPFSSDITVYSLYCGKDTGEEGRCINLPLITYRVSTDRQEVTYWTDTGAPATLTDCRVRNRRNWECWYKDKGGRLSMADGVFREEVLKDIPGKDTFDSVRYVSKWDWWAVQAGVSIE